MKNLKEYITESKSWKFSDSERDAFTTSLGNMLGHLGDDEDIERYKEFKETINDNEFNILNHIYDFLEDYEKYPLIKSRMLDKNEMTILTRFAQWMFDNDAANFDSRTDWDLMDAYEKILG